MLLAFKNYFSFSGRMNRKTYLKTALILFVLYALLNVLMMPVYNSVHSDFFRVLEAISGAGLPEVEHKAEMAKLFESLPYRAVYLVILVNELVFLLMMPAFVKRFHDTGMTGKMSVFIYFPTFVAVLGLITDAKISEYSSLMFTFAMFFLAAMLAVRKGNEGENKYGAQPTSGKGEIL